jgi:hypothetical protein
MPDEIRRKLPDNRRGRAADRSQHEEAIVRPGGLLSQLSNRQRTLLSVGMDVWIRAMAASRF